MEYRHESRNSCCYQAVEDVNPPYRDPETQAEVPTTEQGYFNPDVSLLSNNQYSCNVTMGESILTNPIQNLRDQIKNLPKINYFSASYRCGKPLH